MTTAGIVLLTIIGSGLFQTTSYTLYKLGVKKGNREAKAEMPYVYKINKLKRKELKHVYNRILSIIDNPYTSNEEKLCVIENLVLDELDNL